VHFYQLNEIAFPHQSVTLAVFLITALFDVLSSRQRAKQRAPRHITEVQDQNFRLTSQCLLIEE